MKLSITWSVPLLFSLPSAVQSFTPCSTFGIKGIGRCHQSNSFIPRTIAFSDVSESAATEESTEASVDAVTEESAEASPDTETKQLKERFTVFVGNLPFDTTDEELISLFSQSGSVKQVSIPVNRETGNPRGFAFVDLASKEEVQTAIDNLGGYELKGRMIRVSESLPKDQAKKQVRKTDEGTQKVYVGNLPFDVTEDEVVELFKAYGDVKDVYFPRDRETNQPRGFAFVTLDEEIADKAIEETNGIDFLGRQVVVSLPLEKGSRRPREPRQKLYVGNLSFYTVPDTLREVFEEFGEVYDCYLPEDPESGGSRGFGFVTMSKDAAAAAIRGTDGFELDGRIIRVNEAQPKGSFRNRNDDDAGWDDDGY